MATFGVKWFRLRVKGSEACFTRQDLKTERYSYDVMTPTAARAVFEALYWHPWMTWDIRKIEVENPIRSALIQANEVANFARVKPQDIASASYTPKRTQRYTRLLRDVSYVVTARVLVLEETRKENRARKAEQIFEKRAVLGAEYRKPYLGIRDFPAEYELLQPGDLVSPIKDSRDLGQMPFVWAIPNSAHWQREYLYFRARLEQGVLECPAYPVRLRVPEEARVCA